LLSLFAYKRNKNRSAYTVVLAQQKEHGRIGEEGKRFYCASPIGLKIAKLFRRSIQGVAYFMTNKMSSIAVPGQQSTITPIFDPP
jgi:hypothetical protein